MPTHPAVVTVTPRGKLEILEVPTLTPKENQVKIRVDWIASTPLNLHQADGHLLVTPPQILGGGLAGTVLSLGPDVKRLRVGDRVFGFAWRSNEEKPHQVYVVVPENLLARVPETEEYAGEQGMRRAATVSDSFVTAWHSLVTYLGLELPWPKREGYEPPKRDERVLVWGASSSSGSYTVQVLKWAGYKNILATASPKHHAALKEMGAAEVYDYRDPAVVENILKGGEVRYVLDSIGSVDGSVTPISKIVRRGAIVAVLLPVIIKDASEEEAPIYTFDVTGSVNWEEGVTALGVRTHSYLDNELHAEKLQPEIMPTLLQEGAIRPTNQKIIEGNTLLERAQNALDTLRRKEVSGERLVWRIAEAQ
ncbi:GroES-like protein [Coniophora puteana RWD-64-598 SS2]|uniref:GroES-like protein n=1 Tax=Coniophora puteana (strain RWD-64-598) TaxID=741705 RepID=A0A5M3MD59_CONPW|nr:GroES-like protein [Coniophora puteana RWD-64-598 SS2]EIW77182.1 GroES-like protein [Coniophora puteana RWD-64-598 SS2]